MGNELRAHVMAVSYLEHRARPVHHSQEPLGSVCEPFFGEEATDAAREQIVPKRLDDRASYVLWQELGQPVTRNSGLWRVRRPFPMRVAR